MFLSQNSLSTSAEVLLLFRVILSRSRVNPVVIKIRKVYCESIEKLLHLITIKSKDFRRTYSIAPNILIQESCKGKLVIVPQALANL